MQVCRYVCMLSVRWVGWMMARNNYSHTYVYICKYVSLHIMYLYMYMPLTFAAARYWALALKTFAVWATTLRWVMVSRVVVWNEGRRINFFRVTFAYAYVWACVYVCEILSGIVQNDRERVAMQHITNIELKGEGGTIRRVRTMK